MPVSSVAAAGAKGPRRVAALLVMAAISLSLAGCTTSSAAPPASTSPRPAPSASGTVDVNREATNPDPSFDFGFTIRITAQGFHPQWLVSLCCDAVTWINDTQAPVRVVFDHQLVRSGPIAPGGSF